MIRISERGNLAFLAAGGVLVALTALVVAPFSIGSRAEGKRDVLADELDPFRTAIFRLEADTLDLSSFTRAYGLTRDASLLDRYGIERMAVEASIERHRRAADEAGLGAEAAPAEQAAVQWLAVVDRVVAAYEDDDPDADNIVLAESIPLLDEIDAESAALDEIVERRVDELRGDIRNLDRIERLVIFVMAALGTLAAFVTVWLARDNTRLLAQQRENVTLLERANAAKDDFLGMVSHELKTPITVILGNADIVANRGESLDEATRAEAMADVHTEAQRLNRILDNMLLLARPENAQQVEREPVNVRRLIDGICEAHRQQYPDRHCAAKAEPQLPMVEANAEQIEQVVRNLLTNAEKYSPDNTPIEISARREGANVHVSVLDRGPGIPAGEAHLIFSAFYRLQRDSGRAKGLGLGLAVSKQLVETNGGHMWARQRPGGGSDIGFALPAVDEYPTELSP